MKEIRKNIINIRYILINSVNGNKYNGKVKWTTSEAVYNEVLLAVKSSSYDSVCIPIENLI